MSEILTPREVAAILKVSSSSLEQWRNKKQGPAFFKLGDSKYSPVRYRREDVIAFLEKRVGS